MSLQGSLSIERMCQLVPVSRRRFYRSLKEKRPVEEETEVRSVIQQIALEHRRRYGYRRITAELRRRGMQVNHKRVVRIMREDSLLAITTEVLQAHYEREPQVGDLFEFRRSAIASPSSIILAVLIRFQLSLLGRSTIMSRVLIIGCDAQVSREIGDALSAANFPIEFSAGHADALRRLRMLSFGVVITNPDSTVEEDLALLAEMRAIRPGVKSIVLARRSTPDDVIAALRARVFACFTPPFDPEDIANLARGAASDSQWRDDIQVLSARPGWVSVRVNCRPLTADRLMTFAKELSAQLPEGSREEMMQAFREILLNAMEHGAAFNPEQVVEVTAVRTSRSMVFYVRDPGAGFRRESLTHAAIASPTDDPAAHIAQREADGMRPGGYGLLLAGGTVDELIYNEIGNEVLLVKYMDSTSPVDRQ